MGIASNQLNKFQISFTFIIKQEEKTGQLARQAKIIMLNGHYPPINTMDISIGRLIQCELVTFRRIQTKDFFNSLDNYHYQQI